MMLRKLIYSIIYYRDISKVSDGIEENIYDPNTSYSSSDSPYPSINNEICRERPKTTTTASGLQLCNQSLQQIKNALSTRHVERQQFENKLLEKYTEETEKAETFRNSILKIKEEKLEIMKKLVLKK